MEFWMQLLIVLVAIGIGGRFGGIGLGAAGGLGLAVLVFGCGIKASSPPTTTILIILAVITCVTILQAAGGLDLLVAVAEKLLRARPDAITFLGPFIIFIFTMVCGTSYVAFSMYPVIAEIATEARVRPERAMAMSVIASNMAIVASPMSAAMASMIAITASVGTSPLSILSVTIPGCFLGCLVGCLFVYRRGAELTHDEPFLKKLENGDFQFKTELQTTEYTAPAKAKLALGIFLLAVLVIIVMGASPDFRPTWPSGSGVQPMSIPLMLQIVMMATAALIMIACWLPPDELAAGSVFKSGLIGVIGIFGLSWMTGTFFDQYSTLMTQNFSSILQNYPVLFGVILFLVSMVIYSPAATVAALMPLGVSMQIEPAMLVGMLPAACATFIIPGGAQIACVAFDRTGTTRIGKFVVNHSYMLPGLIALVASTAFCALISRFVF